MTDKVISIFRKREEQEAAKATKPETKKVEEKKKEDTPDKVSPQDFETVMRDNKSRKDKLDKERQKSNKSVLRSYRIKN